MLRLLSVLLLFLFLAGCENKSQSLDDFQTTPITLPNGQVIRAEVMMKQQDLMRGMMYRDSLAADHGLLFIQGKPGLYQYWMYQVRVPLDIFWLDLSHQVVEIAANTPPCPFTSAKECPHFGGHKMAVYVLELPAGSAAKFGLREGDRLKF